MTELKIDNIDVVTGGATLLRNVSVTLGPKELVAVVGPNGAGKSTLLKSALGLITLQSGVITLDGDTIDSISPLERARRIAYLPQIRPLAWPARVYDVVTLGRFAFGASIANLKGADATAVNRALEQCDLDHLAERRTDTLSGGELARVHCARALAANAPLLIADEPVAALDPSHQFKIMALIRTFADEGGGAMVVLHDLSLAARFADRIVWLNGGAVIANGTPAATLTPDRVKEIFNIDAAIGDNRGQLSVTVIGPA